MASNPAPERPQFLLDTGALLQGLNLPPSSCITTPSVLAEIDAKGATGRRRGYFEAAGLHVASPSEAARRRVEEAAKRSGAVGRLSATDIDVLALATDLKLELITDDYTVQDVAKGLGLAFRSATTRGITDRRTWTARCSGCGRSYAMEKDGSVCPVCGAQIRLKRAPASNAP